MKQWNVSTKAAAGAARVETATRPRVKGAVIMVVRRMVSGWAPAGLTPGMLTTVEWGKRQWERVSG